MDRTASAPYDPPLTVAGGPMSREVAHWYLELTDGQFEAHEHASGRWYLYLPQPTGVVGDAARRAT